MSNIVLIENGQAVTSSLTIADGVGNPHASVIRLIRDNMEDLQEFGLLDFKSESTGGRPTEYALLNEQQATLLMTYMRNNPVVREFKKRLVKAFYEMVRQLRHRPGPEMTRLEILQMAIASEERAMQLEAKAAEDAPKVAFHDQVAACDDFIGIREAAQVLGTGRSRLMAKLRTLGWIDKWNVPYQRSIDQGLMQSKVGQFDHPEYGLKKSITPMITGKGLAKLQKILREEAAVA